MATVNSYDGIMPSPVKTSSAEIVSVAWRLLEAEGLPSLTMQNVAAQVGVRAPSLYKHVENRGELIRLVAEAALRDLLERLTGATSLAGLAETLRAFGYEHPGAFQLVMAPGAGVPVARREATEAAAQPILDATRAVCGDAKALDAARTLTAWATGFILMETRGGFRLEGDIDQAWRFGLERTIDAITRPE